MIPKGQDNTIRNIIGLLTHQSHHCNANSLEFSIQIIANGWDLILITLSIWACQNKDNLQRIF